MHFQVTTSNEVVFHVYPLTFNSQVLSLYLSLALKMLGKITILNYYLLSYKLLTSGDWILSSCYSFKYLVAVWAKANIFNLL